MPVNPVTYLPMPETDKQFMHHCLELAQLARYSARPNPVVGALIVKDAGVIAEGWHVRAGQDHAEIMALKKAGDNARGATMYVSLEPCSFTGRTGPCCDAVIAAGISRLVYGMEDPNPRVSGSGLDKIRAAGITVDGPVLAKESAALNRGFIKMMTTGMPYVRCKLAMSLDGRTAMASGESKWITGPQAREDVQRFRAMSGAVLTGIDTVLADDPGLDVRDENIQCEQPLRVIVDSQLRITPTAKTLSLPGEVIIATAVTDETQLSDKVAAIGNDRVSLYSCGNSEGKVDLNKLLRYLAGEKQCTDVLLESGAALAGAMLSAGLVDEIITYIAPALLGSDARPLFNLPGLSHMADKIALEVVDVAMVGKDCRMRTRIADQD